MKFIAFIYSLSIIITTKGFPQKNTAPATYNYKVKDTIHLDLHIYYPKKLKRNATIPAVIFFFGGGWLTQIFLGQLYLQIVEGKGPKSLFFMIKNIRSLIKVVPGAVKKSEEHFNKAIAIAGEIRARSLLGQSHLGLGLLHSAKGRKEKAMESISKAIDIFEEIEAEDFLKQAKEALASLE